MTLAMARSSAAAPQKAFDYISFRDKSAPDSASPRSADRRRASSGVVRLKSARRCAVYLNEGADKRGCRTQWRFRNILRYRHHTQWTAA